MLIILIMEVYLLIGGNDKVVKLYDDSTKTLISKLES